MRIALVGNQNSGKTTLFNLLTGMNQKIGNWPGVTIERKSGILRGTEDEIVDLPGVYSLSPYTAEEDVSRRFVYHDKPDLIINIIDATSIERSLYLTTQLLELDTNVVIALNMADMLEQKGVTVDAEKLSEILGADVVKISALKKTGIDGLLSAIERNKGKKREIKKIYPDDIEKAIDELVPRLKTAHKRFVAVKLLEGDALFKDKQTDASKSLAKEIEEAFGSDMEQIIANERYNYIVNVKKQAVVCGRQCESVTDKLDRVFLNKYAALPIFAAVMFLIYFLAVGFVGGATVEWVDGNIGAFGEWFDGVLEGWNASEWSRSLVVDGIIAGVGAVLNFVPQLIVLFICISLLETTGYMSRIAFFLDRLFKKFGLSGKSLIPFIVGSGCSVPGIMSARTIEDESEKQMTIALTPFIPCSAKLPIIALFAGYFFKSNSGLISASLYFLSIVIILLSALLLKKLYFKGEASPFISELPEYKAPSVRYVARDVFDKTWAFVRRAGTIILLCSVVIWVLGSFSWRLEYGVDVEKSILAGIGNAFAWVFYPILGEWSWGATVSAIQGLVAKEQVVSSMEIIAGLAEGSGEAMFGNGIFGFFTGASAYAFMAFNLFSAPCFGAIAAMKREFGSTKKMLIAVAFQTSLAWALSSVIFGIGKLIEVII